MQNFVKIGDIDTSAAFAEVIQANLWHADDYLRSFPQGPFGETDSIILRFPPRTVHETEELLKEHMKFVDIWDCKWLDVSNQLPVVKGIVFDLARHVEATRIGRVFVNRIKAGGKIFRHADTPDHANAWCRFHVVLHAIPGVDFYCGDEMINMTSGNVYYFANQLEHEVQNNSGEDRIHIVVDYRCESVKA